MKSWQGSTVRRSRLLSRRQYAVLGLGLSVLAAACSGVGGDDSAVPSEQTKSSTEAASLLADDEVSAAIVDGYESYWAALLTAADPPDPDHPVLGQHATGMELERARTVLASRRQAGEVIRGGYEFSPMVISIDGASATLSDCYSVRIGVYDAGTDDLRSPEIQARRPAEVEMLLEDDIWKVALVTETGDGCSSSGDTSATDTDTTSSTR